jgi:predicted metal-dependent enzyme (double-stranded beta helix superfamily)
MELNLIPGVKPVVRGKDSMSTSALPAVLEEFITDVEALLDLERDPQRVALGVRARLPRLLHGPEVLAPKQREHDPNEYRVHCLAVAPSRRFSVMALVWLPGQATRIHDHVAWCVVGVLEGVEREQRFGLRENSSGDRWLIPLDESVLTPGHTSALIPPEENFHRVRNVGEGNELAVSIHIYGADLEVCKSSINQYFDGLPIRADECSGVAVPWRQTRAQKLDALSAPMPANE